MPGFAGGNSSGIPQDERPPVEREMSESERMEQEEKNHFQASEECGLVAYGQLTGKVPPEQLEEIYRRRGYFLENSVQMGALYFGNMDIQPGFSVERPQDYIRAFREFIEKTKRDVEEAETATPEFVERIKKYSYRSNVDRQYYPVSEKNWRFHMFGGKRENFETWIEEAKATLVGFGKTAMEAGDVVTAKEAFECADVLEQFPGLAEKIVEFKDAESERMEQEEKNHFQASEECGLVAYGQLTGKVPPEQLEEIYRRRGYFLENSVQMGALWFGGMNIQPKFSVERPQDYIRAFREFVEKTKKDVEQAETATPEYIEAVRKYDYRSNVDKQYYPISEKNWRFHLFGGRRENYELWVQEARTTLEGFGKTAMEAGDNETYNLVQKVLNELE